MIIVDASVLIAHFAASDRFHSQAESLLIGLVNEQLSAHPLTIAEMLVGAARDGKATARRNDIREIGIEQWTPDADDVIRLAELRARTGAKLPDCCVLSAAIATNGAVATFDEKLGRAARQLGLDTV